MRLLRIFLPILLVALTCCTKITVQPVPPSEQLDHVCIQRNPRVRVMDFLPVLQDGFARHGITSEVYENNALPDNCRYTVTYTALRSWDFAPYLSHAEIYLHKNGQTIASGIFHLSAKGGLTLSKYDNVKTKMDPVIDQMLETF